MGAVVSCIKAIFQTIGNCLMAIVNAIGAVLTAIVNGIVALFDIIISCLTCGRGGGGGIGVEERRVGSKRGGHENSSLGERQRGRKEACVVVLVELQMDKGSKRREVIATTGQQDGGLK